MSYRPHGCVTVGCKADLQAERQVSQAEVEAMFGGKIPVFETSAKTGANLEAPFMNVLKKVRTSASALCGSRPL